ncbi:MAG: CsgG/HfaB family protein [Syntrophales bacterium LBB04]|nr:CsgG/HfaB family protein [Syntrophales bacterium LBB04]
MRFTNNTHAYWWSASTAAELQDMLINELISSRAFHVMARPEPGQISNEKKLTESAFFEAPAKVKTAKNKGTKYLIAAAVSAFEENTQSNGGGIKFPGLSSREEQKKAYVVIDLKVIDTDTGNIVDTRSIEATNCNSERQNDSPGNPSLFYGSLSRQEKTEVGKAIRNCITEIRAYLECFLITKDEECVKKYPVMETKRKEKNKAAIQLEE